MGLSFLPEELQKAIAHLNFNRLSELRLRQGQPVSVEYGGEIYYLAPDGVTADGSKAIIFGDASQVLAAATGGNVFNYAEQLKSGFITVSNGVRIGVAGEYVTDSGKVATIKSVTSLNIRVPHDIKECAAEICTALYLNGAKSTLIFSKPGLGKTTTLRAIARYLSDNFKQNILVFDERNEIAAMGEDGVGFNLGARVDVVRCYEKKGAIVGAIRAMKPQVIITDELYGAADIDAVKYAVDCGITVIASSHVVDRGYLQSMPFEYFVKLSAIAARPEIYDKNFDIVGNYRADDFARNTCGGGQKKAGAGI